MPIITFLGDISFNGNYIDLYNKGINPFQNVRKILENSDLIIANLECLAEGNSGENLLKSPRLKTTLNTLQYLKDLNVNIVTLAHNHVYDNLLDGFEKTINYLKKNNIKYLGAGKTIDEAEAPLILDIKNKKLCFLNFVASDTNPNLPPDSVVKLNFLEREKVLGFIKENKNKVNHIILLLHWGGKVEGGYYPDFDQLSLAREFISAGADLIIGHHSHTLQPYENINGKYVFYSLGNFCFSHISCDGRIKELDWKARAESIILEVNFSLENYSCNLIPIKNKNHIITVDKSLFKLYNRRLQFFNIFRSVRIIWQLYFLKYRFIDPVCFYFFGNNRSFLRQLFLLNSQKIKGFLKG